jgi:hypothetical protein
MSPDLEEKLVVRYPELFQDKDKPLTESLMAFGCECSDGWFAILDGMCDCIASHVKNGHWTAEYPYRFSQIKEKFGGLRVYDWGHDDYIFGVISMAETLSYKTCELCGCPGSVCHAGTWLRTLCPTCADKHGYTQRQPDDEV